MIVSSHGFLRGSCGSCGKALGYGLDGPGSIPGVGGVEIFFTPSYPGIQSTYYKMSTRVKVAERRTSHPTFS